MPVTKPDWPNEGVETSAESLMRLRQHARYLDLRKPSLVRAAKSGGRVSPFRGRGMDYVESRRYLPGDDIRTMDWRVTARSGVAHTKVFQEERERPVYLFTDFSESLFFATKVAFKSVLAARVTALLGWAAVLKNDRIGATLCLRQGIESMPVSTGVRGISRLCKALANASRITHSVPVTQANQAGNDYFNTALKTVRRNAPQGALVCIVSDFYAWSDTVQLQLDALVKQFDVIACRILDPIELSAPPAGQYRITDGVNQMQIDTRGEQTKAAVEQRLQKRAREIGGALLKTGIKLIEVRTDEDATKALQRALASRFTQTEAA